MAKKPLTEAQTDNIITRGISAIFSAVANRKTAALKKKLMKDPEFKASVEKLEKLRDEFDTRFKEKYKTAPGQKEFENWWEDMWNKK
jgi:hypothetical protein